MVNPLLQLPTNRLPTEHEEQRVFVSIFRKKYRPVRIFAIPNGGKRSPATAGRLKAEGVSPGVPDLFIPAWGLFVEMKRQKGGVVSESQEDWKKYLESVGYGVVICPGCNAALEEVEKWRISHNL